MKKKKQAWTWAELILNINVLDFSRQLDIQKKKIKDFNSFSFGLLFLAIPVKRVCFP